MAKREEIIVGLDIGTTKVACLVGEITDEGIDIIGVGTQPCSGLKKGVVVNIDATVAAIAKAVEEAEHMAGVEITQVYAGIAGSHIKAFHSEGVVAIRDREVRPGDIERVIDAAKAVRLMAANPSSIKRPVVEHPGGLLVGFKEAEWQAALG